MADLTKGRPTDYKEEYLSKVIEYINTTGREQTTLPTVEGFAHYIGVDADTIGNWGDKHPDFFGAIKILKEYQRVQLINDGLYGGKEVNQAMAIFLLKANHGMAETTHTDITSGGKPIPLLSGLNVSNNDSVKEAEETKEEN